MNLAEIFGFLFSAATVLLWQASDGNEEGEKEEKEETEETHEKEEKEATEATEEKQEICIEDDDWAKEFLQDDEEIVSQ